jgi:hypothetical protein
MTDHKYQFEKYRNPASKHTCPACEHKRVFTRYIDTDTGEYLHSSVGRCDREDKCGYHYTPKQYFADNPDRKANYTPDIPSRAPRHPELPKEPGRIPKEYLIQSVGFNSQFVEFLCSVVDRYTLESPTIWQIMRDYYLGQTKDGRMIFWQVDVNRRIRTGKIMRYNPDTGRRVKEGNGAFDWVHSMLIRDKKLPDDFNLKQCLFGEHLLNRHPDKTVCIVESEKSAILASVSMPEYLWLSTGGKQGYTTERCAILKGRNVLVFPDLGAFDDWTARTKQIEATIECKMVVVDLLEQIATDQERSEGLDIADYLIRQLRAPSPVPGNPGTEPEAIPVEAFTAEEQALRHLGSLNPNIYTLIETLGLVGSSTGKELRIIN